MPAKKKHVCEADLVKITKGALMYLADKEGPVTNLYLRKDGWDPEVKRVRITIEEIPAPRPPS